MSEKSFCVIDGWEIWIIILIEIGKGRLLLLMFVLDVLLWYSDLWIVFYNIEIEVCNQISDVLGGVICFMLGMMIMIEYGLCLVESLCEGDCV